MIPKRVTLENFLSFGPKTEIAFTDDEPLWVLGGPNGVGKSAVFDAITFCLFGAHRGSAKEVEPLIRHGSNGFSVSFEFEFCGIDYRITRSRQGKSTQAVEQRKLGAAKWERVANINSVSDVRAWSERTLGLPFDAFKASVLLRQGEADAIILAGGTERLKILKKIIGVERYENLSKRVHDAAKTKADDRDRLTQLRDNTPEIKESDLASAQTAAGVAEENRTLAEATKAAAAERIAQARQWGTLNEKRRQLEDKIAAANARATEAEQIRRDKARLDELNGALPTLSQLVPLRESSVDAERRLREVLETHTHAATEQEKLTNLCEGLRLRIATHRETAADHTTQANARRTTLSQQEKFLTAANNVTQLETQLSQYDEKLDERIATIDNNYAETVTEERTAREKLTESNTLLGQAKKEQKLFESVEVGAKCSRCGQPVTAQHAAAERQRIADNIIHLTSRHEAATNQANDAAKALRAVETEKKTLAQTATAHNALRQRLDDQRRNLIDLGVTTNITRLRDDIARLEGEAKDFEQKRDNERREQQALEGELKREKAKLDEKVIPACKKLKSEVETLQNAVIADTSRLKTLSEQLPELWRATTKEQLATYTSEHNRLKSSRIIDRFHLLEEDAARRDEWSQQLDVAKAEMDDIPEPARVPVAEAERLELLARNAFVQAERQRQQTRDALFELVRQAEYYERLKREVEVSEREARIHEKLDERLGKTGLQRELVRDAERQIVRLANDTVGKLSDGELSIELDHSDDSGDEAFALRVRRADDPIPIEVAYLSGSQKFRVAISVALAIGRFATDQARPLECVIIDEGFGSLDKEGLHAAAEELNRLKQYLRRIILVSHQEEFTDHFPVVIRLSKGESGTVAEAVRR